MRAHLNILPVTQQSRLQTTACMHAGQVSLSSEEAEALKDSRQSSAKQDWLMDADSAQFEGAADNGTGSKALSANVHALNLILSIRRGLILACMTPAQLCMHMHGSRSIAL